MMAMVLFAECKQERTVGSKENDNCRNSRCPVLADRTLTARFTSRPDLSCFTISCYGQEAKHDL